MKIINFFISLQAFLHRIRQNAVDKAEKYITEENVKVMVPKHFGVKSEIM